MDNRSASIPAAASLRSQTRLLASAIFALLRLLASAIFALLCGVLTVCVLLSVVRPAFATTDAARDSRYRPLIEKHQRGELQALRIRQDAVRHRLWVLTLEHVYVYDTKKLALIRRIRLPSWSVADFDFMCPPDMALDRAGAAFVSNNVQPRLLQIDPANFQKKEHQLNLISEKQWEIGFGALAFGSDGTLFAVSALAGSLFKIDLASRTAREIALSEPVQGACALMNAAEGHLPTQRRAVSLCAHVGNGSRRVDISSDATHARVTHNSCEK